MKQRDCFEFQIYSNEKGNATSMPPKRRDVGPSKENKISTEKRSRKGIIDHMRHRSELDDLEKQSIETLQDLKNADDRPEKKVDIEKIPDGIFENLKVYDSKGNCAGTIFTVKQGLLYKRAGMTMNMPENSTTREKFNQYAELDQKAKDIQKFTSTSDGKIIEKYKQKLTEADKLLDKLKIENNSVKALQECIKSQLKALSS